MKKDPLKKTLLSEIFNTELSRGEKTKLKIIETAILTFAGTSSEDLSYEDIAKKGSLNRSLINYYFPQRKDLFLTVMKYIRALYQEIAIAEFSKSDDPEEMFKLYVQSTFLWINTTPQHVKVWILFWFLASSHGEMQGFHKELTEMGKERIISILKQIKNEKNKKPKIESSKQELEYKAKSIQRVITGAIIEAMTEPFENLKALEQDTLRQCLHTAGIL
jgi:AcrR family transcriptional regulator